VGSARRDGVCGDLGIDVRESRTCHLTDDPFPLVTDLGDPAANSTVVAKVRNLPREHQHMSAESRHDAAGCDLE
jgi:hypothetical protein